MINSFVVKPLGNGFENSIKKITSLRDFMFRLVERFFKAPLGTLMFLLNKITSISEKADEAVTKSNRAIMQNFQSSNDRAADDKILLSDLEVINQSLVILVLSAIFLILLDWRRQRRRARRN